MLSQIAASEGWCAGAQERFVNLAERGEWIEETAAALARGPRWRDARRGSARRVWSAWA